MTMDLSGIDLTGDRVRQLVEAGANVVGAPNNLEVHVPHDPAAAERCRLLVEEWRGA